MERRAFSVLGFGLVAGFAAMQGTAILYTVLVPEGFFPGGLDTVVLSLLCYLACLGAFSAVTLRTHKVNGEKKGLRVHQFFGFVVVDMGLTWILSFAGEFLDRSLHVLINGSDTSYNPVENMLTDQSLLSVILTTCVLAPFFEELVFRKLLLDRLRPFGDAAAILYSGIAFGLFHMNVQQTTYTVALGLLTGYIVVRTGSWWHGVAVHAASNFIGGVIPTLLSMANSDALYTVFGLFVYAAMGLSIILILLNINRLKLNPAVYRFSQPIGGGVILGNAGTLVYMITALGMIFLTILVAGMRS